jgi:hypothetical protein
VVSGSFNGNVPSSGDIAISTSDGVGTITPTAMGTDLAILQVKAVYQGRTIPAAQVAITKVKAAEAPPGTGGGGGGSTDIASQTDSFNAISSSTFATITDGLLFTMPTGKTTLRVNVDLNPRAGPKPASPNNGPWNIEFRVMRGGVAQGSLQNSSPDPMVSEVVIDESESYGGAPGTTMRVNQSGKMTYQLDMSGLTAGVQYAVDVQARITTNSGALGGSTIGFTGTVKCSAP